MEIRIKYIKTSTTRERWEGYYAVQVKKWIFWKTIYTDSIFANVEKFIDTLAQIDDFNNKTKSLNKIVYNGWAVRNVFKNTGPAYSISFFDSYPSRRKTEHESEILWRDINGGIVPTMEIKTEKIFGKECLEPMRVRITIEQIEEWDIDRIMTKEIFEKLCENNDISWNDKVVITVYNPFKRWYKFGEPKYLVFKGYLLYHDGDEIVKVSVIDKDEKLIILNFDFDKILNIEKY